MVRRSARLAAFACGAAVVAGLAALAISGAVCRAQQAVGPSMRQQAEQGIHYHKKKMLVPAMNALEKARQMPGGERDHRTLSGRGRSTPRPEPERVRGGAG